MPRRRTRLKPVRTLVRPPPGTRLPSRETSRFGERETYLWPQTHWRAVPHLGRVRYRKALPELPPHRHQNAYEICLLREGTLTWELGGRPVRLAAGDLLVVAPSAEHGGAWAMMQPCRLDFLQINAGAGGSGIEGMVRAIGMLAGEPQAVGPEVGSAFDNILAEARRSDVWSPAAMRAAVVQLLAAVLRRPAGPENRYSEPVAYVASRLEKNPGQWPTVLELAGMAGLGATQLQLRFKRETGLSLNAFALERRLSRAKELLADGKSCTEAAMELGFSSSQYFATAFKRHYGVSPRTLTARAGKR